MIIDDLKWFKEDMKWKILKGRNASFSVLTPGGILVISWVTSNGLRWFLNHFEAKR